jgi:hypothetical protein
MSLPTHSRLRVAHCGYCGTSWVDKNVALDTVFANLRYTLPRSAPAVK